MTDVAALYIDRLGPYPRISGVDCWDAARDARLYRGPWPVVAHPPCGPWGKLKAFCTLQDPSLAPIAVDQVRMRAGILEHPAYSRLWDHCRLPPPGGLPDAYGGWTLEVAQCRWGHRAEKLTWLYMVGVDPHRIVIPAWQEPVGVLGSGGRKRQDLNLSGATARRTPPAFAEWLIALARSV